MNSSDLEVYLCPVNHTSMSSETRIRKKNTTICSLAYIMTPSF